MAIRQKAPVISPPNDLIDTSTKISIRCNTEQSDIYYTVRVSLIRLIISGKRADAGSVPLGW